MPKTKVEVYDKDQLIYPFIESDHVTFSNGMKVSEMLDQSISMPTVTHEDLSFKVGVGNQDVSSAIVDSSASEMTIKGKTYQNILPEPSTHVLTNNKEMFKVNEGLDSNVEIVDGVAKSAILKGQTLVNVVSSYSFGGTNTLYESRFYDRPFNAGETFTIFVVNPNVTEIKVGLHNSVSNVWIRETEYNVSDNKKIVYTVPTGDNLCKYVGVRVNTALDSTGFENSLVIVSGDKSNLEIENYFEGMQSVKIPVLTTTGKNLCKYRSDWVHNGLTFTHTNDGVTVNGTATTYVDYYVTAKNSSINVETLDILNSLQVGTRIFLSNNLGKNSYISYKLNGETQYANNVTIQNGMEIVGVFVRFQQGDICNNLNLTIQLEIGNEATPYEPHKSNILHTPEEVVLRSVENAQDTINLNTGEYVQRIGEVILNGSESWQVLDNNTENTIGFTLRKVLPLRKTGDKYVKVNCDKLPSYKENLWNNDKIGCVAENNINQDLNDTQLQVRVLKSTLSTQDTNGFKSWLQTNPLKIQYILETPTIKTVDLSSSGNWEKIVLDGSETGWNYSYSGWANKVFYLNASYTPNLISHGASSVDVICEDIPATHIGWLCQVKGRTGISAHNYDGYTLQIAIDGIETIEALKQYLSQNPLTVWYQTRTHLDSTQVKQPIFFKDGHINQSSRIDNSLIPTLDYQAKTSNSYVMDLMKTNTRYTMKAKSASGTFTIDGTSYGAETNGTFTTPTSMTNKLLVMSNKTNEEVMILEGDVVSKTIPYFKGIKSAFEDKSKIEVLSTGKNWVNLDNARLNSNHQKVVTRIENGFNIKFTYNGENFTGWDNAIKIKINVKRNTDYTVSLTKIVRKDPYGGMSPQPTWVTGYTWVRKGDSNNESFAERNLHDGVPSTMKFNSRDYDYVTLDICSTPSIPVQDGDFDIVDIQIEESSSATVYESYKSNNTKIPLLSPLRSLPNGVCDEIVLDREKNKATLIQRVGVGILDGTQSMTMADSSVDTSLYQPFYCGDVFGNMAVVPRDVLVVRCDKLLANFQTPAYRNLTVNAIYQYTDSSARLAGQITRKDLGVKGVNDWFRANPTTVYYQLATPVVTEIDLEGFPYVYKDGHIFLNSEIAPTMEITYSINQGQQISASNEDIIRHEKELTYLQKLIAQYVQVDYESALLSLKV